MLKVGPNEQERQVVIAALKGGQSFADATKQLRAEVEPEWFDRNREHLLEVAGVAAEKKPAPPSASAHVPTNKK